MIMRKNDYLYLRNNLKGELRKMFNFYNDMCWLEENITNSIIFIGSHFRKYFKIFWKDFKDKFPILTFKSMSSCVQW